MKVRLGTRLFSLLGECLKHVGCYEVNYSNNKGILLLGGTAEHAGKCKKKRH